MKNLLSAALIGSLVVSAQADAKTPKPKPPERKQATLVLPIAAGKFDELVRNQSDIYGNRFKLPAFTPAGADTAKDQLAFDRIGAICGAGSSGGSESFVVPIIAALIKPLFGLFFHNAADAIDKKIEDYKVEWKGRTTLGLFGGGAGAIAPNYRCIRLVRVTEDPEKEGQDADNAEIEFDALMAINWVEANRAWQLVPLRVYTHSPVARGTKVTYAVSLSGNAVTETKGKGDSAAIPETLLFKGAYKIAGDADPTNGIAKVTYPVDPCLAKKSMGVVTDEPGEACNPSDKGKGAMLIPDVPALAIPGTVPDAAHSQGSAVNLSFNVAEAGEGKRLDSLQNWKTYLGKAGDGLSEALTAAITGLFDKSEEE